MSKKTSDSTRINLREFGFHPLSLRLWHGMTLDAWLRAMHGKWHLISPRRYPLAFTITLFSLSNQFLKWISDLAYGRRLAEVRIEPDPIFIIGHWRSGTTWLHHLLMMDSRHAAPTQGACFCPEHFLLTQKVFKPILQRLMPEKRPMDNVSMDLDKAEEDELAICLSGAVSSYASMMFPSEDPILVFDPDQMEPKDAKIWRQKWLEFLRRVQFVNPGKRLVLKSPTHSLRIPEILRQFPKAQFIHIRRDPYRVFLSNQHTQKAMESVSALQDHLPIRTENDATKMALFVAFHQKLEADRAQIPEAQFTSVRYEDLREDTVASIRDIYDSLNLGCFSHVEPEIRKLVETPRSYKNNTFDLDDETRAKIDEEFADFFTLYGYLPMDQRAVTPE